MRASPIALKPNRGERLLGTMQLQGEMMLTPDRHGAHYVIKPNEGVAFERRREDTRTSLFHT
jgi:hypothetical protein